MRDWRDDPAGRPRDVIAWRLLALYAAVGAILLAAIYVALAPLNHAAGAPLAVASPIDGGPAIGGVRWVDAADNRVAVEDIPWCQDSSGHAVIYPCKWDSREREPRPPWDAQAAPIGIWVIPSKGCPIGQVKTSEDNSVPWSCYWAPGW